MNDAIQHANKTLMYIAISLVFFIVVFLFGCIGFYFWSKYLHGNCSYFDSYESAYQSYKLGNTELDGNGNGIPCETLYKKSLVNSTHNGSFFYHIIQ